MANRRTKPRSKRGYPVAVLVGFEEKRAVLWQIFSKVVRHYATIELNAEDKKGLYNFRESIVNLLRPLLQEGVRSIVVAGPMKTDYARSFLDHVKKRHLWLFQDKSSSSAAFGELAGSAGSFREVSDLINAETFRKLLRETTSEDANHIMGALEKRLSEIDSGAMVLYSLEEIEGLVTRDWERGDPRPEYIVLTDRYLADNTEKNRVHRLLQISKNKRIRTKIVSAETKAGVRLSQLGGLVCFTASE